MVDVLGLILNSCEGILSQLRSRGILGVVLDTLLVYLGASVGHLGSVLDNCGGIFLEIMDQISLRWPLFPQSVFLGDILGCPNQRQIKDTTRSSTLLDLGLGVQFGFVCVFLIFWGLGIMGYDNCEHVSFADRSFSIF